jgi:hypothetical protein
MHGGGVRLLARQELQDLECRLRPAALAVRGAQDKAGVRMAGDRLQDLRGLQGGKLGIPLE